MGIKNHKKISVSRGNNIIVGLADAEVVNTAIVNFEKESSANNISLASANSKASVSINTLAIGIDNIDQIVGGQNQDIIAGIANTSTNSEALATATANAFNTNLSLENQQLNKAVAKGNSIASSNSLVSNFGIFNSGKIFTWAGDDVIFGLANSESLSNSESFTKANSEAKDIARAEAKGEAIGLIQGATVGIVNPGAIFTGMGDDTIIGLALNQATATADGNSEAIAIAENTDTDTNFISVADTSETIAIGIDNSDGVIKTGRGNDEIIAYGDEIGILGGIIRTGEANDKIAVYGGQIGIEESTIYMGTGDDYFHAAIGKFDSLTGKFYAVENQSNSIVNSQIFGNSGNDTFEIGNFTGEVLINGGVDFDILRLQGNFDSYQFTVDSSSGQTLTIEDADSILTVKNIEVLYLGESEQTYSFDDFI